MEEGVKGLLHARKFRSSLFLISYSGGRNEHGLSLVDVNGDVLKSVGESEGPAGNRLNIPWYFALDGAESVFLVDRENRRVLLFSPDLESSVELATRHKGLRYPRRVCLESTGRMFVADNWFDFKDNTFSN